MSPSPAITKLLSDLTNESPSIPLPIIAIRALLNVIQHSPAETMMGLQAELHEATHQMIQYTQCHSHSPLSLTSSCHLFLQYVTRTSLETTDFHQCKSQVLERGERLALFSLSARDKIALVARHFVREGSTILTHGSSSVVQALLMRAAKIEKKRFRVIVLEGRPDASGAKSAKIYEAAGIPTRVVLDAAMGYIGEQTRIDMVLVGAEGVAENGGIVNKLGTFALGIVAKELGVPFYVAVQSYKFTRLFPLDNADWAQAPESGGESDVAFVDTRARRSALPQQQQQQIQLNQTTTDLNDHMIDLPPSISVRNPTCDFTPAKYITLLFTDLGVLTPSAVSDELIRLYQ